MKNIVKNLPSEYLFLSGITLGIVVTYFFIKTGTTASNAILPRFVNNNQNYDTNLITNDTRGKNCMGGYNNTLKTDTYLNLNSNPNKSLPDDIKSALAEAITDEYKARSTYLSVINKFGLVRPFSMIVKSEEQHIAALKSIYNSYGLTPPSDDWIGKIIPPDTLQLSCKAGVDAEIANAKLYKDKLLPMVSNYPDISYVFNNLMNASELKHLPAFKLCM